MTRSAEELATGVLVARAYVAHFKAIGKGPEMRDWQKIQRRRERDVSRLAAKVMAALTA